jgi:hypothetical protein
MIPTTLDPITTYALLYVALTGNLYPIFTLILLHMRGVYTLLSSILAIISWTLSTAVLFKIIGHLRKPVTMADYESGFKSLFNLQTCGGSSTVALCQQMMGQNPLGNFSTGYQDLHFFPISLIIWAINTFVLLLLLANFISSSASPLPWVFDKLKSKKDKLKCLFSHRLAVLRLFILSLYIGAIIAAFWYQARIFDQYLRWDVIDYTMRGWSFGQIVAVLTLAPSVTNFSISLVGCVKYLHNCLHLQYSKVNDSPDEEHGAANGECESAVETVQLNSKRYTISSVASTYLPTDSLYDAVEESLRTFRWSLYEEQDLRHSAALTNTPAVNVE